MPITASQSEVASRDPASAVKAQRHVLHDPAAYELAVRTDATIRFNTAATAGEPEFRLVIGMEYDPRAWVRVANALLDRIASGAVRAGSRVPPVASFGVEHSFTPGAAARAFRHLTDEGVLRWVPGLGYHVQTKFTVMVSDRPRRDGGLTAVLLSAPQRHQAGRDTPGCSGTERR